MKRVANQRGVTLIELVVVMAIFIGVILISTSAFEQIAGKAAQLSRSTESNIEGIMGLEIMRTDIAAAGFGLPWSFSSPVTYTESDVAADFLTVGIDPDVFNDSPSSVPRAILCGTSSASGRWEGTDHLVLKGTSLASNDTAKRWSYVNYTSSGSYIKRWNNANDVAAADRVITIGTRFTTEGVEDHPLMVKSATEFNYLVPSDFKPTDPSYAPADPSQIYIVYGLNALSGTLKTPFNRVDYYIKTPAKMPASCAPNTGILYKANLLVMDGASAGGFSPQSPLLDCVADMQVTFEMDDGTNTGNIATISGETIMNAPYTDPKVIRDRLKTIRVYILAHEGGRDRNFKFPSSTLVVGPGAGTGRTFDLAAKIGTGWEQYRWKIYTISVRPRNLTN